MISGCFPFIHQRPDKGKFLEIFLLSATIFFAAAYLCFPVPYAEDVALLYPWWAKKITFYNLQFYEGFFLLWIVFFGHRLLRKNFWDASISIRASVFVLTALALWCGLISIIASPLPGLDAGRSLRLLLNATMLCAVFYWSQKKDTLLLAAMISGFLAGTIINFIISYQYPWIVCGVLRMAGQNTPGVAMAVAIHMCAWLFSRTHSTSLKIFTVLTLPVFIFGSLFSSSKTAWIVVSLGMVIWVYIFLTAQTKNPLAVKMMKIAKLVLLLSVIIPLGYFAICYGKMLHSTEKGLEFSQSKDLCAGITFLVSPASVKKNAAFSVTANSSSRLTPLQELIRKITVVIRTKYYGLAQSDSERMAYFRETAEIITKHPFGVGYAGFYEAAIHTDIYKSGKAVQENSISEANPHSSFLWYTSAGGIPGGLMAVILFVLLLKNVRTGLVCAPGKSGPLFFAAAVLSYLTIGLVVPYIYNSIILIVPAAIAAGWASKMQKETTEPYGCPK